MKEGMIHSIESRMPLPLKSGKNGLEETKYEIETMKVFVMPFTPWMWLESKVWMHEFMFGSKLNLFSL